MDETDSSPVNLVGEVLGDRYRLTDVLGAGGMGSVYLATDEQLSRQVAIKVPHDEFLLVPGFLARFKHEIRQLIDLEHPHIVTILDGGEFDGRPFAVLQFLGGGNLDDRLELIDRNMTVAEVLRWLPAVAESLDFIHRKGFLHRDIKPGNIFFDDEGHAFVADFGIALALGREGFTRVTQAGTVVGSPVYMAPEYGSGEAGPTYDQYALAVVVYECLSGELPHPPQATPVAYLATKMVDPPAPLGPLVEGVPNAVINTVMKALSIEPEDRYESCTAFAAAVADGAAAADGAAVADGATFDVGATLAEETTSVDDATIAFETEPETAAADTLDLGVKPVFGLVTETTPVRPTTQELLTPDGRPSPEEASESAPPEPESPSQPTIQDLMVPGAAPPPQPPVEESTAPESQGESGAEGLLSNADPIGGSAATSAPEPSAETPSISPAPWSPEPAPAEHRPPVERRPRPRRPPPTKHPMAQDDTTVLVWTVLKWMIAFAVGFFLLSEGSYALFGLFNPMSEVDPAGARSVLVEDIPYLIGVAVAINLLLSLVVGYAMISISSDQWVANCVAVAVAAIAMTVTDTGSFVPLANTWALGYVSFNGQWLSMAPVPLGLLIGGFVRSLQRDARWFGYGFAAAAIVAVIALRTFFG